MQENELRDYEQRLQGISLPTVDTSLHKSLLRTALWAEMQRTARPRPGETLARLWALLSARRFRSLRLALSAALLLLVALVWQELLTPPPTLAYATLHANPAVQLTLNTRGRVTAVAPLSPEAALLFVPDDFRHLRAELALSQIVSRLHAGGFLRPSADLALLLQAAPAMPEIRVKQLADTMQRALESSLLATGTEANLRRHTVSQQVYVGSRVAGLLPLDFMDLLETELEDEDLIALFLLKESLPLDEPGFRARFAAMSKKMSRELRADMKRDDALELGHRLMTEELDQDEGDPEDNPRRGDTENEDSPQGDDDPSSRQPGQGEDNRREERERDHPNRDDKEEDKEREPVERPVQTEREDAEDEEDGEDEESPRERGGGGE